MYRASPPIKDKHMKIDSKISQQVLEEWITGTLGVDLHEQLDTWWPGYGVSETCDCKACKRYYEILRERAQEPCDCRACK